ncbi:hypothetical protein [Streptomyces vilmorinianum]|uniref:hypothetical protein n=1 Tax=Streptomyces vilmorinianum TaxID=3051092 RepID=UPI0010FBA8C4|nr:hypothetical protein [Streptomyces vilmorinianum]
MTLAQHLATVDLLRARAFPADGYHLAELAVEDPRAEQAEAEREALALLLADRWGPPDHLGLYGLLHRYGAGEAIPRPWDLLCTALPEVQLWRADGRWIVLGTPEEAGAPARLLVCVTEVDPP